MTKNTWIKIIENHTEPLENDQHGIRIVKANGNGRAWIEVLVKGVRQDIGRESSYAGLKGERLRIDLDDHLVLYHKWSDSSYLVVSYVLWQDVGCIKIITE